MIKLSNFMVMSDRYDGDYDEDDSPLDAAMIEESRDCCSVDEYVIVRSRNSSMVDKLHQRRNDRLQCCVMVRLLSRVVLLLGAVSALKKLDFDRNELPKLSSRSLRPLIYQH